MHLETKMTAIPQAVKVEVFKRDGGRCIVCGSRQGIPNSHVIRRSQGGLGIKENVVTHCITCHALFDGYDEETRAQTMDYIYSLYPDWKREKVVYKKHGKNSYK